MSEARPYEYPDLYARRVGQQTATAARVLRRLLLYPGDYRLSDTERDALETVLRHAEGEGR